MINMHVFQKAIFQYYKDTKFTFFELNMLDYSNYKKYDYFKCLISNTIIN